jgi:hypothetical protein
MQGIMLKTGMYILTAVSAVVILWLGVDFAQEAYKSLQEKKAVQQLIAAMEIPKDFSPADAADHVRNFIFNNSIHKIDEEFYDHWGNQPVIISRILAFYNGERTEPPHMECSSRSNLMRLVMDELGYRTRNIDVYMHAQQYPSHTFLEFFNLETGNWEAQDVDYNVFWIDRKNYNRVKTEDLIKNNLDNYIPCTAPAFCSWKRTDKDTNLLHERLALAVINDKKLGERYIIVNTKRFDLNKPAMADGKMQTYCQYRAKDCRQKIIRY